MDFQLISKDFLVSCDLVMYLNGGFFKQRCNFVIACEQKSVCVIAYLREKMGRLAETHCVCTKPDCRADLKRASINQ